MKSWFWMIGAAVVSFLSVFFFITELPNQWRILIPLIGSLPILIGTFFVKGKKNQLVAIGLCLCLTILFSVVLAGNLIGLDFFLQIGIAILGVGIFWWFWLSKDFSHQFKLISAGLMVVPLIVAVLFSHSFKIYSQNYADVIKAYKSAISKTNILVELGLWEEQFGDEKKAIQFYSMAVKKIHSENLYLKLGELYFKRGEDTQALRSIAMAVKRYPESEDAYKALINLFLKKGQTHNALTTARAWVNALPKSEKAKQTLEKLQSNR